MPAPIAQGDPFSLTFIQGEPIDLPFQLLLDQNDPNSGISLLGYTGKAQLRARAGVDPVLLELTVAVDQTTGTSTSGSVRITATEAQTKAVAKTKGVWDCWLIGAGASDDVPFIAPGPFTMVKQVTKT